MEQDRIRHLEELEKNRDFVTLIKDVRDAIQEDRRIFTHPFIKKWIGRRFRNLFITETSKDEAAVRYATYEIKLIMPDNRPPRQRIAERFLKGDERGEWRLEMPEFQPVKKPLKTTLVFSPGLLTGMLPVHAFHTIFPKVEKKMNIRILRADCHPMRGSDANVADLVATLEKGIGYSSEVKYIDEKDAIPPGDIFFMCYSKGISDVVSFLIKRPDLAHRVKCVLLWGGAIGGSYLANGMYDTILNIDIPYTEEAFNNLLFKVFPVAKVMGPLRRFDEFDVKGAIRDLTTHVRQSFLDEHKEALDKMNIPFFNITAATSAMEVPLFQLKGFLDLARYDGNNDMQLVQSQAKMPIPMATDLVMLHANHWDISYESFPIWARCWTPNLDHPFPKEAIVTTIVQFMAELGLID